MTAHPARTVTAPDLSPAEAAVVARFDAAPVPKEVMREQVARELWTTGLQPSIYGRTPWEALGESARADYRRLADAALAVIRQQPNEAVQRVGALCDYADRYRETHVEAADVRAAIAGGSDA